MIIQFCLENPMNLKKIITKNSILFDIQSDTKTGVIEELIDFLVTTGKIKDRDTVLQAVLNREAKMSTGMQNGIAIPHGKTDSVDHLEVIIAISRKGVDFEAMDGQPCFIFILTLSPENRTGPHIQLLAEISKLLGNAELREKLTNASSAEEILSLIPA